MGDALCCWQVECRYFYAADSGRCCLKSDYDTAAPLRTKIQGDFCEVELCFNAVICC